MSATKMLVLYIVWWKRWILPQTSHQVTFPLADILTQLHLQTKRYSFLCTLDFSILFPSNPIKLLSILFLYFVILFFCCKVNHFIRFSSSSYSSLNVELLDRNETSLIHIHPYSSITSTTIPVCHVLWTSLIDWLVILVCRFYGYFSEKDECIT